MQRIRGVTEPRSDRSAPNTLLRYLPLLIFVLLAALFFVRLFTGDASRIPSALIGKSAPEFSLPQLTGLEEIPGLKTQDLRMGHVSIVNIFASWCAPCRQEHPILMSIAEDEALKTLGIEIYGLSYKDEIENARKFLQQEGNPFRRIGVDSAGRVAIDFGVYGVPETFVITGDGIISFKFVGPLTSSALATVLVPEIHKALGKITPP